MKLNKIVDKIKKILKKDEIKKSQEDKILKLVDELTQKRAKAKKELKELKKDEVKRKKELEKRVQALSKLIKKSKSLI